MKILKIVGIVFLLVVIAAGGYAFFVYRQVTDQNVKDLGVRYTTDDYDRAVKTKAHVDIPDPSALYLGSRFTAEGTQPIDQTFTDAEISAIQNYSNEKRGPFRQVQIHFIGGNKVEASGYVVDPRVPKTGPVYVKGDVIQTGPKSFTTKIDELRDGSYVVPGAIVDQANGEFLGFVNGILSDISGLSVEKVDIQDGMVHFKGMIPKKLTGVE